MKWNTRLKCVEARTKKVIQMTIGFHNISGRLTKIALKELRIPCAKKWFYGPYISVTLDNQYQNV